MKLRNIPVYKIGDVLHNVSGYPPRIRTVIAYRYDEDIQGIMYTLRTSIGYVVDLPEYYLVDVYRKVTDETA